MVYVTFRDFLLKLLLTVGEEKKEKKEEERRRRWQLEEQEARGTKPVMSRCAQEYMQLITGQ